MLDLSFLPIPKRSGDIQIFYPWATQASAHQYWHKPRGVSMVEIICIGAGGAGGNGQSVAAGVTGVGGGSGGSGSVVTLKIPAFFLPDVLFISVAQESVSRGDSTSSSNGSLTRVSIGVTFTANEIVCYASSGGFAAGGASGGAVGNQAAALAIGNMPLGGMGFYTMNRGAIGQVGTSGGAAPTNIAPQTSGIITQIGGAGGSHGASGAGSAGAGYTAEGLFPAIAGGVAGTGGGNAGDGNGHYQRESIISNLRFMLYGGTGGGSADATGGNGGAGGKGSYGCGGGGGGVGVVGGAGGVGGGGLCIISCW
jgi:hypothetical protein